MYIYECHMGGLYATEESLDYDDLYCETCGDSDYPLCDAENAEELRKHLGDGWDARYIDQFIKDTFPNEGGD